MASATGAVMGPSYSSSMEYAGESGLVTGNRPRTCVCLSQMADRETESVCACEMEEKEKKNGFLS